MVVVTKVELPAGNAVSAPGYVSLDAKSSPVTGHRRLAVLAKSSLAATIIFCNWMEIWVRVNTGPVPVILMSTGSGLTPLRLIALQPSTKDAPPLWAPTQGLL